LPHADDDGDAGAVLASGAAPGAIESEHRALGSETKWI
jgi:hypothetical protein